MWWDTAALWIAAACALVSAWFWWRSAHHAPLPEPSGLFDDTDKHLKEMHAVLSRSSEYGARAALFAAGAAVFAAIEMIAVAIR